MAAAAADVEDVENAYGDDHRGADSDLPTRLVEAAVERLQVMRNRERRQGEDDQVVDQDRPAGDEGDQLVEGVANWVGTVTATFDWVELQDEVYVRFSA